MSVGLRPDALAPLVGLAGLAKVTLWTDPNDKLTIVGLTEVGSILKADFYCCSVFL